jgi:hypothetical protein
MVIKGYIGLIHQEHMNMRQKGLKTIRSGVDGGWRTFGWTAWSVDINGGESLANGDI